VTIKTLRHVIQRYLDVSEDYTASVSVYQSSKKSARSTWQAGLSLCFHSENWESVLPWKVYRTTRRSLDPYNVHSCSTCRLTESVHRHRQGQIPYSSSSCFRLWHVNGQNYFSCSYAPFFFNLFTPRLNRFMLWWILLASVIKLLLRSWTGSRLLTQNKVKVTLRLTVNKSACLGVEPRLGLMTRCFFLFESYCPVPVGRPLWQEVGSVICQS
jgi:hypothetical protein